MSDKVPKKCPFCHSLNIHSRIVDIIDREGLPVQLYCDDCGASGGCDYTREYSINERGQPELTQDLPTEALKVWNTRADEN